MSIPRFAVLVLATASMHVPAQHAGDLLAMLGEVGARLRGSHHQTQLETRALLTPAQGTRYVE